MDAAAGPIADPLTAEELNEIHDCPPMVHLYDAYRIAAALDRARDLRAFSVEQLAEAIDSVARQKQRQVVGSDAAAIFASLTLPDIPTRGRP